MRSRLPHRRDSNHAEIAQAFEQLGCSVFDSSAMGDGFPDLVIGLVGLSALVEIKTPDGFLTPAQECLIERWRGPIYVVATVDDVTQLVQSIRRGAQSAARLMGRAA